VKTPPISDNKTSDTEVILQNESPVEALTAPGETPSAAEDVAGKIEKTGSPVDTTAVPPVSGATEAGQKDKKDEGWTVIVKRGEWIYLIIEREYGYASWAMVDTVVKLNERVSNPNRVYPGQKLYLPPRSAFE